MKEKEIEQKIINALSDIEEAQVISTTNFTEERRTKHGLRRH